MATTAKSQKDKSYCPAPKLAPRPTAASAARAARNATNRNLNSTPCQRQSPSRASSTPSAIKAKSPISRNIQRTDSKGDVKTNLASEPAHTNESTIDSISAKSPISRNIQRTDSKGDVKTNLASEPAHTNESTIDSISILPQQEVDTYVENSSVIEEKCEVHMEFSNIEQTQESTIDVFVELKVGEENRNAVENVDVHQTPDHSQPKSRPRTPALCSRPQTPKVTPSRPQTPRMPSRPSTPAHHGRIETASSRPNTPQRVTPPARPRTPLSNLQSSTISVTSPVRIQNQQHGSGPNRPYSPLNEEQDIKGVYSVKQKQFQQMKKELDLKQQALLEVFECLRNLSERMSREGVPGSGEDFQPQELTIFNVTDWASEEVGQLYRNAIEPAATDGAIEIIRSTEAIDETALIELDAKVSDVPARFADLCLQAFTARQELIDWIKELIEKNQQEDGGGESVERISRYNAQGLELCEALRELKSLADNTVDTVTQFSKRTYRERSALLAVGETLVREIAHLRESLESGCATINELKLSRADSENNKLLEETRRELEEEKTARIAAKDKLATTESQLRQTRIRVSKMDRQLREAEASIASLTGTVKTLEDQSRQREVQLEARARKLKESLKTGEVASKDLIQQRDALQTEVLDLKDQIETMSTQHKANIQDLNNQIKYLKNVLEEQQNKTMLETKQKEVAEGSLAENQNIVEELKVKIAEMERNKSNPELPTEREMDIWAELQATKETLRMTEEEVTTCKREKVRFLETLTKITETENKIGMQQKLAAELLSKEEIIGKMQSQIRELTKNIKLNEQKVVQYEQYVRDLQAHNRAVANCQEAPNGISYQDLQQEIMNLRMNLLEAVHRNEELAEILAQKEQQVEQQDKTSRAQARVIKVREELINMLKNKETEQSRELGALQQDLEHRMKIVDEVNKQIATKADEIQELFATLENKQQQIHRLEKIVLALEEQQRRAQAQRTRHEEKIAALEHELAAGGNRRERKFIFF